MCMSADWARGDLSVVAAGRRRLVRAAVKRVNADTRLDHRRRLVADLRAFLGVAEIGDLVAEVKRQLADEPRLIAQFAERVEEVAILRPPATTS